METISYHPWHQQIESPIYIKLTMLAVIPVQFNALLVAGENKQMVFFNTGLSFHRSVRRPLELNNVCVCVWWGVPQYVTSNWLGRSCCRWKGIKPLCYQSLVWFVTFHTAKQHYSHNIWENSIGQCIQYIHTVWELLISKLKEQSSFL